MLRTRARPSPPAWSHCSATRPSSARWPGTRERSSKGTTPGMRRVRRSRPTFGPPRPPATLPSGSGHEPSRLRAGGRSAGRDRRSRGKGGAARSRWRPSSHGFQTQARERRRARARARWGSSRPARARRSRRATTSGWSPTWTRQSRGAPAVAAPGARCGAADETLSRRGPEFVRRLRGAFALALWDRRHTSSCGGGPFRNAATALHDEGQ